MNEAPLEFPKLPPLPSDNIKVSRLRGLLPKRFQDPNLHTLQTALQECRSGVAILQEQRVEYGTHSLQLRRTPTSAGVLGAMRQCVVEVDHNIGRLALSYQKAAEALGAWKKGQIDRAFGAKKDFKHAASGKIPRDLETSLNEGIAALESYQTKNNLARSGGEKLTPGTPGRPIEVPFERTVEQTFDRAQPVGPQKRDGSPRSSARPNSAGQRRPRKLQRKR